ncbi:putative ATPase [Podospora australis]|uniref:ATPase n=1 Tax=Podospora australis TaxID=1536484 RepID=A0AAN6WWT6_9PEZI|nr:putative ATPase [Podospora australis]
MAPGEQWDATLRHQHSASSDQGRALVPMWDSSDPERAPPPLPLNPNPQSPNVPVSRTGTSSAIQSAHAALAEKARESAALVPHVPKRHDASPERPLPIPMTTPRANAGHRRMQSSVKDISMMIENGHSGSSPAGPPRSPEKSDLRPVTPSRASTHDSWLDYKDSRDRENLAPPSPRPGPSLTPILRPTARRAHQSILGENTPPQSATMLALQNMSSTQSLRGDASTQSHHPANNNSTSSNLYSSPVIGPTRPDPPPHSVSVDHIPHLPPTPLANITNGSSAANANTIATKALVQVPQSLDLLSNQILTLTDIATTLQKEMSLLSRRSRDNATDLLSLKEATNARDEDIRKSLRDLISEQKARSAAATRDPYGGPLLLEGGHRTTSPTLTKAVRPFSLPRIPSPNSFAASLDRESILSTPSLVGSEQSSSTHARDSSGHLHPPAQASPQVLGLLEKIIREMGTKDGQTNLISRLADLGEKMSGMATAEKIEELSQFIKAHSLQSVASTAAGGGNNGGGNGGDGAKGWAAFDDDDDRSTTSSRLLPGSTSGSDVVNEDVVKAIKTIKDSIAQAGGLTAEVKALLVKLRGEVLHQGRQLGERFDEMLADKSGSGGNSSLAKEEMERIVEQGMRQLSEQMHHILEEHRNSTFSYSANAITTRSGPTDGSGEGTGGAFDAQELYNAMRAALKDTQAANKQQKSDHLRREDVMQAVKDAWEKYKPEIEIQQIGLERDEVLACLQEGLRDFTKPNGASRDEVFSAVVEGMKHFNPPKVESLSREEILDAVRECLEEFEFPAAEPVTTGKEVTREDVADAVREGLAAMPAPDAKEKLSRDDVIDAVADALEAFDFGKTVSNALVQQPVTKSDVGEAVNAALKGLDFSDELVDVVREGIESTGLPDKVLAAVNQGLKSFDVNALAAMIPRPDLSRVDVADAVKEGLEFLDLSRDDVADAVKEGLEKMDLVKTLSSSVENAVRKILEDHDFSSAAGNTGASTASTSRALVPRSPDMPTTFNIPSPFHDLPTPASSEFMPGPKTGASTATGVGSVSKEDVLEAVQDALDSVDFSQDMAKAVKGALESFDFSVVGSAAGTPSVTKSEVVDAVKEGLQAVDLSTEIAADLIDVVRKEFEQLDLQSAKDGANAEQDPEKIVDAVKRGLQEVDLTTEISADVIDAIRKEFAALDFAGLKEQSSALVAGAAVPTAASSNNEEVLAKLLEIKEAMVAEFKAASVDQDGFEKLRQDIEAYVDQARGEFSKEEYMQDLLRSLDGFRGEISELVARSSDKSSAAIKEEIESLRDAVNGTLVPVTPHQHLGSKEILEALHDGIGSLRSELSTRPIAGLSEILDAMQEGLGDIKISIQNLRDKPADLTANDEILDALRSGLDSLRSDIDEIRKGAESRALATVNRSVPDEDEEIKARAVIPAEHVVKQEDIKRLEVLLTQLGTKVEAMQATTAPSVDSLSKEDIERMEETVKTVKEAVASMPSQAPIKAVEDALKKIQDTVDELSSRDPVVAAAAIPRASTDAASREDVEAIETILRNTKGKLDDFLEGEQAVRKDHIDALETLILETRESLGSLVIHLDTVSKKDNIDALETLILETRESVAGVSSQMDVLSKKEDVAMVESLVNQVIASFDDMRERHEKALEDPEKITKTDVEAVEAVCLDTKVLIENIMKSDLAALPSKEDLEGLELQIRELKECMDFHAAEEAKNLDDRQAEIVGVADRVEEVKGILTDFHGVLRTKLEEGARGVDSIHKLLDAFSSSLSDAMTKNETASDDLKLMIDGMKETLKAEIEDSKTTLAGAQLEIDDSLKATSENLVAKLDERMAELMVKYDELKAAQEERAAKGEERDVTMEAAVVGNKAIAEELKILVDTLGSAVTDSMEKMEEASKTVFTRVEDLVAKSDENTLEDKADHQLTRETVQEAIGKVEGLSGTVNEYHPKILESLQEVMTLVGQHYETLHANTIAIQERADQHQPALEKVEVTLTGQGDTLDKVHSQVRATAAELATFLAAQTQRIADEHEDREKSLQETIIALERRLEEKTQVEAELVHLREEQERLKHEISVEIPEEQEKMRVLFLANLQGEEVRLREGLEALKDEQRGLRETFFASLKEEQARMLETTVAMKEEQELLKTTFLDQLREEQARIEETNTLLREEQDLMRSTFLSNFKEEETRLKELNAALQEEGVQIRDTYLKNLREEESLLKEVTASLRTEQEEVKAHIKEETEALKLKMLAEQDEVKAALKIEYDDLKEKLRTEHDDLRALFRSEQEADKAAFNTEKEQLKAEQEELRVAFKAEQEQIKAETEALRAAFKTEQETLKAALQKEQEEIKAAMKTEQEEIKVAMKAEQEALRAAFKEENEKLRAELLASYMDTNAALRMEQDILRETFLKEMKDEEERLRESLAELRADQEDLTNKKNNLRAELSTLDAACNFRREEIEELKNKQDYMERKVLEGVMDMSRVMLMRKTAGGFSEARSVSGKARVLSGSSHGGMSRKRVASGTTSEAKVKEAAAAAVGKNNRLSTGAPAEVSERRILSLSQISNNLPGGGMNRSQNVRTPAARGGVRKSSWQPSMPTPGSRAVSAAGSKKGYADLDMEAGIGEEEDKENVEGFEEGEYENVPVDEISIHEDASVKGDHDEVEPEAEVEDHVEPTTQEQVESDVEEQLDTEEQAEAQVDADTDDEAHVEADDQADDVDNATPTQETTAEETVSNRDDDLSNYDEEEEEEADAAAPTTAAEENTSSEDKIPSLDDILAATESDDEDEPETNNAAAASEDRIPTLDEILAATEDSDEEDDEHSPEQKTSDATATPAQPESHDSDDLSDFDDAEDADADPTMTTKKGKKSSRRDSQGTTVITPAADDEDDSDYSDLDDGASDWSEPIRPDGAETNLTALDTPVEEKKEPQVKKGKKA